MFANDSRPAMPTVSVLVSVDPLGSLIVIACVLLLQMKGIVAPEAHEVATNVVMVAKRKDIIARTYN
jgi:hypothetical protein